MTINYRYAFSEDSFTYFRKSGVVKSVQANFRGTDPSNGLFYDVPVLAVLPEGSKVTLKAVTKTMATKWLDTELAKTPGLQKEYKEVIAGKIADQVSAAAEPTPEKEVTGTPDGIE